MKAWLIYDKEGSARNQDYISYHREAGKKFGIDFEVIIGEKDNFILPKEKPDFAIVRTICPSLNKKLGENDIPTFNNAMVSEICNDKGKTIKYIKKNTNVPVPETLCFTNQELTQELLLKYPNWVIKAVDGHGGQQVFRTTEAYDKIKQAIGDSPFVLQSFVNGPGKDVRVYVIGKEIIAAVERSANKDFKSNFSLGGTVRAYDLSQKEEELVKKICNVFEFGLVGIDFLMDETGNFVFNEIEDVVGARMLYQCYPNIQLLEKYFSFLIEKILQ